MKITLTFLLAICISIFSSSCNKINSIVEEIANPTLKNLEKSIRKKQDPRAKLSYEQYEKLLTVLDNTKFIVLPINNFRDSINTSKVLIGMRHDIDCHPFKALELAKMEKLHGFNSTFFILASSAYYGKFIDGKIERFSCMEKIYHELHSLGNEIGIHNDLISLMIMHDIDPYAFNHDELSFYKSIGIKVVGTAAHGSSLTSKTVDNFQIFSDFAKVSSFEYEGKQYQIGQYSLKDFGFDYEAYFIDFNHYYSDTHDSWVKEGDFNQFLEELRNSIPGDKIQILTHPVWWGK